MRKTIYLSTLVFCLVLSCYIFANQYTQIDFPGAYETELFGIDGSIMVGDYQISEGSSPHGFIYNGGNWITLDFPESKSTTIRGVNGNTLVGYYEDVSENYHGFIYDGTWTTLDFPNAFYTYIEDIEDNMIVGRYYDQSIVEHGFTFSDNNYKSFDYPFSTGTYISGIHNGKIVGSFEDYNGATNGGASRINYAGGVFTVDSGLENHPVTYVSWYGATAFAEFYGYKLPNEWKWQAVADYDGSYIYGCGTTINNSIANYYGSVHPDGTTVVGAFGTYGYGMCDMAGNVWEWTSSCYYSDCDQDYRVVRGGDWINNSATYCAVGYRVSNNPSVRYANIGFRVVLDLN